jgi:hypothetical protein
VTYGNETQINDKKATQKYLESIIELYPTAEIVLAKSLQLKQGDKQGIKTANVRSKLGHRTCSYKMF